MFSALCASLANAQSAATGGIEKRIQAARKAVEAFEATRTDAEILSDELLAIVSLKIEQAQMLLENYQPNQALVDDLNMAEALIPSLGKINGPLPLKPGLHELAYIAENDLSPQPYLVYIPKSWSPDRPTPLFIFHHGYASYLDKVNWIELMYSPDLEALMEKLGFILLMPFGRSNTEFMGIGEADVLRTVALVRQRLKIDEDRIFISGASMGGSGAYTIACHYPHLFAGVMAIAGRYDYYLWKNIDPDKLAGFKRLQTDLDYARALLPNLRNVHTFIFHGDQDPLVQLEQSRGLFNALSALGFSVTYKEFAGGDHWIWEKCFTHPPFAKWLSETRREANPRIVEYQTYSLKYNRAYWVTINDVERWGPKAFVRAEVAGDNLLSVRTQNVASLTLNLNDKLVNLSKPVTVRWNEKEHQQAVATDGSLVLGAIPGDASALRKTADLMGPVREVFTKRFLIVCGTSGSEEARKANLNMALQAGLQWQRFSAGRARVKADAQLTETELKTNDLILIGAPDNNSVIARLRDHLPIKWTEEEYVVGNRKFPASGNGLLVIYPSPFSGGRDEGRGTRGEGRGEVAAPRPASPVPRPPSRYVLVN
jgi:poly(3-hydroxybutyrate) depolymerase